MGTLDILFDFVKRIWEIFYEWTGQNDFYGYILVNYVFTYTVFWVCVTLYGIMDLTGWPSLLTKYRVQPASSVPVDKQKYWHAVKVVIGSQLFITLPFAMLIYPLSKKMGMTSSPEELPSIWMFMRDFAIFTLVDEITFYYAHRLLHYGPFYRAIHKQHHEWIAPTAVVSEYSHPIEYISGLIPLFMGPLLMGSHLLTCTIWNYMFMTNTTSHHSGYHLPFLSSPQFHDYHHLKFNVNYGGGGLLDWLHGTHGHYEGSIQQARHRTFYSLTPIHEQVTEAEIK